MRLEKWQVPGEEGVKYYVKEVALYLCCYHAEELPETMVQYGNGGGAYLQIKDLQYRKVGAVSKSITF